MFYYFSNFTIFFQVKQMEESLVEVEKEHSLAKEKHSQRVITIDFSEGVELRRLYWKNLLWR